MTPPGGFSFSRWWSIVLKEFLQLRRDRLTFAMIVGIPIVQLALFGYAINTDPKQMPFFYFLPNILLSGFMFPFQGMPAWAQFIGNLLPLTYFNRLTRGIFLKGNGLWDLWPNLWPLMAFTVVVMAVAVKFYRRTLD